MTNENLLCRTGNSTQCSVVTWMGRKSGKEGIYVFIADSLCCAVETNTRLPSNYIPTERLHFHFSFSCIGEGNGNPLQCSCLENPRDRGQRSLVGCRLWGVAQSQTQLKWLSSSSSHLFLLGKSRNDNCRNKSCWVITLYPVLFWGLNILWSI